MIKRLKKWLRRPDDTVEVIPRNSDEPSLPLPADTGKLIRVGLLILGVGFGGFLLWAIFAPLDEGIPAPGQVIVEGKRKTVQHLTGGIVREIAVSEAQLVNKGDVLIRLDDTLARANLDATRQTKYYLMAMEARLRAEQRYADNIQFPEELLKATDDRAAAERYIAAQRQLFAARRNSLRSALDVLAETAAASEAMAQGFEEQIALLKPQLAGMRDLVTEGYAPRNRQLELERQLAELQANALRARRGAAEARLRANQARMDFQREVDSQLADVLRELGATIERERSQQEELNRTVIVAPTSGAVTDLQIHTTGGVISPGQKLMDIVPHGERLILEVRVPAHLIDRVQTGLPADINFQAFVNLPHLIVDGRVISVSADVLLPSQPNVPPYFLARVEVTPEGQHKLGNHQIQPGMPADVVIKTGSRSLLFYLMKPLIRRITTSMTEA